MATTQNTTKPISSFLCSARFFNGFFMAKSLYDAESSPTSVLNPFGFNQNLVKPRKIFEEINNPFEKFESDPEPVSRNGIALALIQENPISTTAISRKVLFGSKLKIQIPSPSSSDPLLCCDFGIKTRKLQCGGRLISTGSGSLRASMDAPSLSEMELSEEYTRVITYGSNPKTTHIYDNCVVDCCCDVLQSDPDPKTIFLRESFLSLCHTCKKNLEDDRDIFMYRGDKAFCSEECRCQEMVLDGLMNSEKMLI